MRSIFLSPGLFFLAAVTSGCGGSGGTAGTSGGFNNLTDYNQLLANAAASGPTDPADMPSSGSAGYAGVANIGIDPATMGFRSAAVGEMAVNVNFGAGGAVSGSIGNFQYLDQTAASGSMAISGGSVVDNELVAASATGTVGGFDVDMSVEGNFVGDAAQFLYLYFDGTSTSGSTTQNTLGVGIGIQN